MMIWLTGLVLAAALIVGGGTRTGFLGDVATQLLAIPLLLLALMQLSRERRNSGNGFGVSRYFRVPVATVGLLCFLIILQLSPLPPEFYTKLTGASLSHSGLDLVGVKNIWRPISLAPHQTWASAASLLVPIAIFFAVAQLDGKSRLRLCWLLLVLGAISLLLGLLQVALGPQTTLRLFEITNINEAVGFFANRNHFAAQLYVTLVLAAVWFIPTVQASLQPGAQNSKAVLWFAISAVFVIAIIAGLAMARSRAGVFLAMAAIVGIAAMVISNRRTGAITGRPNNHWNTATVALAVLGFSTVFATQFGLQRILTRFESDPVAGLRLPLFQTTLETAVQSAPFGTGLGSFVPVYARVEKATDIFQGYANRAHNDYAEFLLEAGIPGVILLLIFFCWFLSWAYSIWLSPKTNTPTNQLMLQQAATIVIALLLAHSCVDYPLRTTALAALFAFSCALIIPPANDSPLRQGPIGQRHATARKVHTTSPASVQTNEQSQKPALRKRWGTDVDWPAAWRKNNTKKQDDEST